YEIEEMYPAFDAIAKLQNEKGAQRAIHFAIEAEKIHAEYYKNAKESLKNGKDLDIPEIYICPVCGWTLIGEPPDKCPICGVKKDKFKKF
ncbi:MAG: rubredoxin-like domain-containing protein, partial [candidate division WOR-3 bacterium]